MKYLWMFVSFFIASVERSRSQDSNTGRDLYSSRYDNVNIDSILSSSRLVTNYVQCLLNRKPCPPEGKDLKRILPEALRSKCVRCSPIQKEHAIQVIRKLYDEYPNYYKELCEKYDPTGEYNSRFLDYIQGEQFNLINSNDPPSQTNIQVIEFNSIPSTHHQHNIIHSTSTTRRPLITIPNTTKRTKQKKQKTTTTTKTTTKTTTTTTQPITKRTKRPKRPKTRVTMVTTQRPAITTKASSIPEQPKTTTPTKVETINFGNRFGGDDEQNEMSEQSKSGVVNYAGSSIINVIRNVPTTEQQQLPQITTTSITPTIRITIKPSMQTTTKSPFAHPDDLIDSFFVPPTYETSIQHNYNNNHRRPIAGLINQISTKISTIAGMLRDTVHVIVGH